jgi:RHS repeat-associated protein
MIAAQTSGYSYDAAQAPFTGKERDAETGLDYFGARYFSGAQGRFTSPDPDNYDARLEQPQSWNMYGYTWNNPLKYVDDDGRAVNLALAGIGAGVGFGTGFVGSAWSQYIQGGTVDWGKAAAYGAGGAVSGATAGFTFGGSLLVAAVAEVGVATAGNVAGGITARALSGEDAFDSDSMSTDAQTGMVGGFLGSTVQHVGTAIAVPIRPKVPTPLANVRTSLKRMAMLRAWEAAKKSTENRFGAIGASMGAVWTNVITQVNSAWENHQNWQNYLSSLWFEFASRQQQTPDVKSKICYAGEAGCPVNP